VRSRPLRDLRAAPSAGFDAFHPARYVILMCLPDETSTVAEFSRLRRSVLTFDVVPGLVAQGESVRLTRGRSLVRSQSGPQRIHAHQTASWPLSRQQLSRSSAHACRTIPPMPRSTELAAAGYGCRCRHSTSPANARVCVRFVAERVGRDALRPPRPRSRRNDRHRNRKRQTGRSR
jgi:hypothetical protein